MIRAGYLLLAILILPASPACAADTRLAASPEEIVRAHAIAMNGAPKYPAAFSHFDYVNPQAPKQGLLRRASIGTFDSLNPYIAKGNPAEGLTLTTDTLMAASRDEPLTRYGLIARTVEYPADRSWVIFHIDPRARFQDGRPVTAADVVFSFTTLMEKGSPLYARYYADVSKVDALDDRRVRFDFGGRSNRELPLILGQLPVLPAHYWASRDFSLTTLDPPLASGPYRIEQIDPGRAVTYALDADYWARDLPVNRGRFNFSRIRFDYYRDATVALEAFKSGSYDFRRENIAKQWATAYTGPPFEEGRLVKETIPNRIPAGMQCFVMNQRRTLFTDRRVRYALAHAFDFEWTNQQLFYGMYHRTDSYFENSDMAAQGLPSPAELAILAPLRDQLWPEVFTRDYAPPAAKGPHGRRQNLLKALALLRESGWHVQNGALRHADTGEPFDFEILIVQSAFERVVLPFVDNLKRLGIRARVRLVDSSQYINRLRSFDFDMIVALFSQSLSPGNEQRWYWSSDAADVPGTRNYAGIRNPAVDRLVELVIGAKTRRALVNRCRALDRALLWGHYVIPQWYAGEFHVAYASWLKHPDRLPPYGLDLDAWWAEK